MKNNYAVKVMLLFVLIALPNLSTANVCLFNQSDLVPREVILLNQGNHQHIRIKNATINIDLDKPQEYVSSFLWILFYNVTGIRFTGNVSIGDESKNYELNITKLKGVREHLRKRETVRCSMSFIETEENNNEVQPKVENAIMRLAQSCIRSVLCQPDINEIDRDADLTYGSVQTTLNAFFDYFVPKLTPRNLSSLDYVPDLNYSATKFALTITFHSFNLTNLSTIRRLRDVVILSHENNKFTASGMFRFNDMNSTFIKSFPLLGIAELSIFSSFIAINATFELDLSSNSCNGKIVSLDLMYAENATTKNSFVDLVIKKSILDRTSALINGTSFNCENPVNQALSGMLTFE